jgi:hypothetical protein
VLSLIKNKLYSFTYELRRRRTKEKKQKITGNIIDLKERTKEEEKPRQSAHNQFIPIADQHIYVN